MVSDFAKFDKYVPDLSISNGHTTGSIISRYHAHSRCVEWWGSTTIIKNWFRTLHLRFVCTPALHNYNQIYDDATHYGGYAVDASIDGQFYQSSPDRDSMQMDATKVTIGGDMLGCYTLPISLAIIMFSWTTWAVTDHRECRLIWDYQFYQIAQQPRAGNWSINTTSRDI